MIRFCLSVYVVLYIWNPFLNAEDTIAGDTTAERTVPTLVVVSDKEIASLLSSLPPDVVLGVLIHDSNESYEIVNARALAMRHATYFIYHGGRESSLTSMCLERLKMQGVVAIDLQRHVKRRNQIMESVKTLQHVSLLTELSIQP